MNVSNGAQINLSIIGHVESCYKDKFGTPRQPGLVPLAQGKIWIDSKWQPEISLQGLQGFSYVWVVFLFHQNTNSRFHAKVHPPRLGGDSVGVFATRSPHRPNPIGLSLLKLESVQSDHIVVSGLDLVEGTPVLDIKPYLVDIESVTHPNTTNSNTTNTKLNNENLKVESNLNTIKNTETLEAWMADVEPTKNWTFTWTELATKNLQDWQNQFQRQNLNLLIEQVISLDPRPVIYRGYEGQEQAPYRQTHALRLHEGDIHFRYLSDNEIEIYEIIFS